MSDTKMGIKPGDAVLVIEHRGGQQLAYNALVLSFSMDQTLAGTKGEPSIRACFVEHRAGATGMLRAQEAVHVSHRAFTERRTLGYEELPNEEVVTVLRLMLDQVDYTKHACRPNEMVGAVLPPEIIERAKGALGSAWRRLTGV